jgi:hypothetical protein
LADQLSSQWRGWFDLLSEPARPLVLHPRGVLLDAGWDLHFDFPVDGCLQFFLVQIFHPHLGMFLRINILVYAHPLVQVGDEYAVEGRWKKLVFGFEASKSRPDRDGGCRLVVAGEKQLWSRTFSAGFDLVSFLLGQFKQGIANAQLADPDSFRFSRAVLSTKAVEATLDKIHRAS